MKLSRELMNQERDSKQTERIFFSNSMFKKIDSFAKPQ
jgi:hypothetical protein